MTPTLHLGVIHESNITLSMEVSFFAMPSHGPEQWAFQNGVFLSKQWVTTTPSLYTILKRPSKGACFEGIEQKKTPPCSLFYI
jgi:hypothetical protein